MEKNNGTIVENDKEIDKEEKNAVNKQSDVETIFEMLASREVFYDQHKKEHIKVTHDGKKQCFEIKSGKFKHWLYHSCWSDRGLAISESTVTKISNILRGETMSKNLIIEMHNRVFKDDEAIWYDLSSEHAVKIQNDSWQIVDKSALIFAEYEHQKQQVYPCREGDIELILDYLNVDMNYKILFLVYLISCFVPNIPHPILVLHGEKGAAKTTAAKLLKCLIDPSQLEVMSIPHRDSDFVQTLSHHWFCNFDNISRLTNVQSDMLCKAVTGDGNVKRKLYSNDDDVFCKYRTCVCLTGISNVAEKDDLIDRCIIVNLNRITAEKRKSEEELLSYFATDKPKILGGIFDILSKAKTIRPGISLKKVDRMADFVYWGYAIAEAIGGLGESFLVQYEQIKTASNLELLSDNVACALLIRYMANKDEWTGRSGELLEKLIRESKKISMELDIRTLAAAGNRLVYELNRNKSNLEKYGKYFEIKRRVEYNYIHIKRTSITP